MVDVTDALSIFFTVYGPHCIHFLFVFFVFLTWILAPLQGLCLLLSVHRDFTHNRPVIMVSWVWCFHSISTQLKFPWKATSQATYVTLVPLRGNEETLRCPAILPFILFLKCAV